MLKIDLQKICQGRLFSENLILKRPYLALKAAVLYLAIIIAMYSWYPAGTAAAEMVTGGMPDTAEGITEGAGIPTTVGIGFATDGLVTAAAAVVTDELGDGLEGDDEAATADAELEAVLEEAGRELLGDDVFLRPYWLTLNWSVSKHYRRPRDRSKHLGLVFFGVSRVNQSDFFQGT